MKEQTYNHVNIEQAKETFYIKAAKNYQISDFELWAWTLSIRECRLEEIRSKSLAWVFFWCLFMYRIDLKNK